MATTIIQADYALTTSMATAYTVPAGKYLEVTLLQIANIDGTNSVDVSADISDTSAGAHGSLAKTVTVAAKDSLSLVGGGLLLPSDRTLKLQASANSDAVMTLCGYLKDNPA